MGVLLGSCCMATAGLVRPQEQQLNPICIGIDSEDAVRSLDSRLEVARLESSLDPSLGGAEHGSVQIVAVVASPVVVGEVQGKPASVELEKLDQGSFVRWDPTDCPPASSAQAVAK